MLSFKGMRSIQCLEAIIKRYVQKTDRKTPIPESFPENGFHHSRFPANFPKVLKKRRTAAL